MVQEFKSPVRVHKFPFEMVMAVSIVNNFVVIKLCTSDSSSTIWQLVWTVDFCQIDSQVFGVA